MLENNDQSNIIKCKEDIMVTKIAIVEDEEAPYNLLASHIQRFAEETGQEFSIERFDKGNAFLLEKDMGFGVVFLDIELPNLDGLSIARRFRETNKIASIVFVTNLAKYAQYGYEVDAISYLIKPVTYDSFTLVFRKALNAYSQNEEYDFVFKLPGGLQKISIKKLMYVEILAHIIHYHLTDETIEKTGTMSKVEKLLAPYGFLRCHNAYLVNPSFVRGIHQNEVVVGSENIPLARAKKKAFLEGLSHYYLTKAGKDELL